MDDRLSNERKRYWKNNKIYEFNKNLLLTPDMSIDISSPPLVIRDARDIRDAAVISAERATMTRYNNSATKGVRHMILC